MRKQLPQSIKDIMDKDERVVVLLGDIGVHAFKEVFEKYPKRCFNIGICEQTMVGMAAGMAMAGLIPIVHTIEPFLVDRAFEQIKDDFGYQELFGTFVGVDVSGNNYGFTHESPYALKHMRDVPNMKVCSPKTAESMDFQLKAYYDKRLIYMRIK